MTVEASESAASGPQLRLCHIKKEFPEQEYGFDLHGGKHSEHFIGSVVIHSPADLGGLLVGDNIIAVNGVLIEGLQHRAIVTKIKENPLETHLLVIDLEGLKWYQERGIKLTIDSPNIKIVSSVRNQEHLDSPNDNVPSVIHSNVSSTNAVPLPRICTLQRPKPEVPYGFSLHVEKGKGHFIGAIDADSIAQYVGLEEGQRLVGVNGVVIYPVTSHKEVIGFIKTDPLKTSLLVASPEVDAFYTARGLEFSFASAENVAIPPFTSPPLSDVDYENEKLHANGSVLPNGHGPKEPTAPQMEATITKNVVSHEENAVIDELNSFLENNENDNAEHPATSPTLSNNSASLKRVSGRFDVSPPLAQKNGNYNDVEPPKRSTPPPLKPVDSITHEEHHAATPIESIPSPAHHKATPPSRATSESPVSIVETPPTPAAGKPANGVASQKSRDLGSANQSTASEELLLNASGASSNGVGTPSKSPTSAASIGSGSELEDVFNLSAAELRERLASRKRVDPRKQTQISLKQKYELIQNL